MRTEAEIDEDRAPEWTSDCIVVSKMTDKENRDLYHIQSIAYLLSRIRERQVEANIIANSMKYSLIVLVAMFGAALAHFW